MDNKNSNAEEKTSFFSDFSWKSAVIFSFLAFVFGGTGGGTLVATKGVKAEGLSQDQADVRYVTKAEKDRQVEARDKQVDGIRKEMLTREVFDAYHKNDVEWMQRMEKSIQQILENQNRFQR